MCRQWAGAALAAAAVAVGTLPAAAAMLRVQAVRHPRSARAGCPVPRRVRQGRLARRCLLTVTHDVATGSPERKSSAQSALHSAGGCRTLPFLSSPRAAVAAAPASGRAGSATPRRLPTASAGARLAQRRPTPPPPLPRTDRSVLGQQCARGALLSGRRVLLLEGLLHKKHAVLLQTVGGSGTDRDDFGVAV
ncbi:Protein of unknown function [Gryllus bimaculatus]|nr:Protein of unknown function [Gryllus bimaculatus]